MARNTLASGDFVQAMIGSQSRLYSFIMSLVCDANCAADVLQQTNLVMWEKSDQFEPGTNFMAWAFQIARFQVMALRQRQRRDRLVFDDATIALVADEFSRQTAEDDRLADLSHCLAAMREDHRLMLKRRYELGLSVARLAEELGQTANHVAVRLHRLRMALLECIRRRRPQEAHA